MGRVCKYQYTHFIYPFVVESKKYDDFLKMILKDQKNWSLKMYDPQADYDVCSFFLPYMKNFLFKTLYWSKNEQKAFKNYTLKQKYNKLKKIPCLNFEYNLGKIKTGNVTIKDEENINFDISRIRLIIFEPGICFLDIKTEIDTYGKYIDFDTILDFNFGFRELTPRGDTKVSVNKLKANNIDNIKSISSFIESVTNGYETNNVDKLYYNKMFTYSYVCLDESEWKDEMDFKNIENDFYRFQYVVESSSQSKFNTECEKLIKNRYSRWQYSMFGFSNESGVVLVSEKEKYNITKMPHYFDNVYIYMMILGLYQRIRLLNFSQELLISSKSRVSRMQNRLTEFVHFSWFSQITNSEHGEDIWKKWQEALDLHELFEEVHKEYQEYCESLVSEGQNGINVVLMIVYIISTIFAGISVVGNNIDIKGTWMETGLFFALIMAILCYPCYLVYKFINRKIRR